MMLQKSQSLDLTILLQYCFSITSLCLFPRQRYQEVYQNLYEVLPGIG